jgi:hypothetical protein
MTKIWIFGDNSSCVFNRTKERRFEKYRKFRNDNFPPSWSELLASELNLKLNNFAVSGQSNYDIFEWFCKLSPSIKENDIILIGWGFTQRFRLFDEYTNDYITIRPNALTYSNTPKLLNGITLSTINEMLQNRLNNKCIEEIKSWELLITEFCKAKNCKVLFWTFDKKLNDPKYIGGEYSDFREHLFSIGAEDITMETKGRLIDDNFGEKGHLIQYQYFLNIIKNCYE